MSELSEKRGLDAVYRRMGAEWDAEPPLRSHSSPARVITDESEFGKILAGDLLVRPITAAVLWIICPSSGALATDRGGILSHPAFIAQRLLDRRL